MKEALMKMGQRGQVIYDQQFRAKAEKENRGKFLVLDVNSGDFEIGSEDLIASSAIWPADPTPFCSGFALGRLLPIAWAERKAALADDFVFVDFTGN